MAVVDIPTLVKIIVVVCGNGEDVDVVLDIVVAVVSCMW